MGEEEVVDAELGAELLGVPLHDLDLAQDLGVRQVFQLPPHAPRANRLKGGPITI